MYRLASFAQCTISTCNFKLCSLVRCVCRVFIAFWLVVSLLFGLCNEKKNYTSRNSLAGISHPWSLLSCFQQVFKCFWISLLHQTKRLRGRRIKTDYSPKRRSRDLIFQSMPSDLRQTNSTDVSQRLETVVVSRRDPR